MIPAKVLSPWIFLLLIEVFYRLVRGPSPSPSFLSGELEISLRRIERIGKIGKSTNCLNWLSRTALLSGVAEWLSDWATGCRPGSRSNGWEEKFVLEQSTALKPRFLTDHSFIGTFPRGKHREPRTSEIEARLLKVKIWLFNLKNRSTARIKKRKRRWLIRKIRAHSCHREKPQRGRVKKIKREFFYSAACQCEKIKCALF